MGPRSDPEPSPFREVAERGRGLLADLLLADVSAVDELIAERRREAAREDAEADGDAAGWSPPRRA
jgi:hypothetical protein